MDKNQSLPGAFFLKSPWDNQKEVLWPASSIVLHRNLKGFPFPSKMEEVHREQTLKLIQTALLPHLNNPKIVTASTLSPHEKEFIFEHFLLQEGFEKFDEGHALIIDETASFLGLINIEDHLHLHFTASNISLKDLWKRAFDIERSLSKQLDFAFSKRFGYLTSDPSLCGTGLSVQAFLHLPSLIQTKSFPELSQDLTESIICNGLGKEGEFIADLVLIENRFKLGTTEEAIILEVEKAAQLLIEKEKASRTSLSSEMLTDLKDKVGRAYGLLAHSYKLQIQETLSALSLIQFANELGWVTGDKPFAFYNLFFDLRRAHLLEKLNTRDIPLDSILEKRAEVLHETLKQTSLRFSPPSI